MLTFDLLEKSLIGLIGSRKLNRRDRKINERNLFTDNVQFLYCFQLFQIWGVKLEHEVMAIGESTMD